MAGGKRLHILGQASQITERKDAARNRARILEAARNLLKERSIDKICMDELARTAGVGKGTLYRRFADRASLCRALLHEEAITLQNRVLDGLGLPLTAPWLLRLEHFLSALFNFVFDNAALLSEAQAFERGRATRFEHPAHTWQSETITLYLERAIRAGELQAGNFDPSIQAEHILAALDPDRLRWHSQLGHPKEKLEKEFRRFWRFGVGSG